MPVFCTKQMDTQLSSQHRYQFFISSTYTDLVEARQQLMVSLLEQGHIPMGMGLYPTEENALWPLIQKQIDASDYYVVIVGGRYGSLSPMGLSYTHQEFIYASTRKKPILALLYSRPDDLPEDKREATKAGEKQMADFRQLVMKSQVAREWSNLRELHDVTVTTVPQLISRFPSEGWVRGNGKKHAAVLRKLRQRVQNLESSIRQSREEGRKPSAPFPDQQSQVISYQANVFVGGNCKLLNLSSYLTWGQIFSTIAPHMLHATSEDDMRKMLEKRLASVALQEARQKIPKAHAARSIRLGSESFNYVKIRLRSLGVIVKADLRQGGATGWRLTRYGDQLMTQLLSTQ